MATHHHGHHHEDMLSVEDARDQILSQLDLLLDQKIFILLQAPVV